MLLNSSMIFKIATLLNSICLILILFILAKQYGDMATLWDMTTEIDTMFKEIVNAIKDKRAGTSV